MPHETLSFNGLTHTQDQRTISTVEDDCACPTKGQCSGCPKCIGENFAFLVSTIGLVPTTSAPDSKAQE